MTTFVVEQFYRDKDPADYLLNMLIDNLTTSWCWKKFYCTTGGTSALYLRNDGKVFSRMQESVTDLKGGTYYQSYEEAQVALDRYNAIHANGHESISSNT